MSDSLRSLLASFDSLTPESTPRWGAMSPQHMLEHLVGTVMISNGRARAELAIAPEKAAARREFLFSEHPFPQNVQNPIHKDGLPPLRRSDLDDARRVLARELERFESYWAENPGALHTHPVFGDLSLDGWLRFHEKHFRHHAAQFGLV